VLVALSFAGSVLAAAENVPARSSEIARATQSSVTELSRRLQFHPHPPIGGLCSSGDERAAEQVD
jgi:hypothetical protein